MAFAGDDDTKAVLDAGAGKSAGNTVVYHRAARDLGGAWPMLTRTNYGDWALLMQVMLEARQLWVVVSEGTVERKTDRTAMECLLRSVPPEMISTLAIKPTAKEAWNTVKTMRLGVERVQEARAMVMNKAFDNICFKDGEDIDEFGIKRKFMFTSKSVSKISRKRKSELSVNSSESSVNSCTLLLKVVLVVCIVLISNASKAIELHLCC